MGWEYEPARRLQREATSQLPPQPLTRPPSSLLQAPPPAAASAAATSVLRSPRLGPPRRRGLPTKRRVASPPAPPFFPHNPAPSLAHPSQWLRSCCGLSGCAPPFKYRRALLYPSLVRGLCALGLIPFPPPSGNLCPSRGPRGPSPGYLTPNLSIPALTPHPCVQRSSERLSPNRCLIPRPPSDEPSGSWSSECSFLTPHFAIHLLVPPSSGPLRCFQPLIDPTHLPVSLPSIGPSS